MGKTITSSTSSKAKKSTASSAKRSITKKALSSTKKSATNKKVTITTSMKSKKKKKNDAPPLPKGWPASSKLTYPTPRDLISVNNKDTNTSSDSSINLLDSDEDKPSTSPSIPANYLTPGNILQQSCNGSDVQLKKRAVQSTSMIFPNPNSKSNNNGPTRFLIVFPGRMSLKVPPVVTKKDDDMKDDTTDDNEDGGDDKPKKKKNPFTPTNPPQTLGKLISLDERNMELRIPFPTSNDDKTDVDNKEEQEKQLVMSGRAIPLSGKYMALSFKRTGGGGTNNNKEGSSKGGKNNKKIGTGKIECKDVFRSVIVLGDSKLVDGDGKKIDPTSLKSKSGDSSSDGMKHYGGSSRTIDGGGIYGGTANGGRKSLKSTTTTASRKRKDSITSNDLGLSSDDDDSPL